MRFAFRCLLALLLLAAPVSGKEKSGRLQYATIRSADGFDLPVGKPNAEGYYRSRGLISGRHMGDDWNGGSGGNSDLGAPVYATAHGMVLYARNARMGWGKTVIIRHAYWEKLKWNYVDSLYTHLHQIFVREGQQIKRGQLVGSIGTNRGMYVAHLHFEIRKNLRVGINQGSYKKSLANYHKPYEFILSKRQLSGGGRRVKIPINTFRLQNRQVNQMGEGSPPRPEKPSAAQKRGDFKVNRFGTERR